MSKHYVVYCVEHLRDGMDESASIVPSLERALDCIDRWANGYAGCNMSFKLFELGKEIPLTESNVEVNRVVKVETKRVFSVAVENPT